jgi:hypothetical protein
MIKTLQKRSKKRIRFKNSITQKYRHIARLMYNFEK